MEGATGEEAEKAFFEVLGHGVRRRILLHLYDRVEMSYTDLLHNLKIGEGTLNFHLKKMAAFIRHTEKGTYILSEKGRMAVNMIYTVRKEERAPSESSLLTKKPLLLADVVAFRVAAFLIDAFIFFIFTGITFDPVLWGYISEFAWHATQVTSLHPWLFHSEHLPHIGELAYRVVGTYAHIFFAVFIFITLMEAYKGQTPGKYVVGVRAVKVSGEKMGMLESGIRNAGKVFLLPLDLIVGVIFYSRKGYIRFFDYYTAVTVERIIKGHIS